MDHGNDLLPTITYTAETGTFHLSHDWDRPLSLSVVIALAIEELSNKEREDIAPLNTRIDPDALNEIFEPRSDENERTSGYLRFTYEQYTIFVYSDGNVILYPPSVSSPEAGFHGPR